ncbi:MAG: acetyl-CoA acetyltransferase [Desulfatibacillaceae bacterium]
MSKENTPVIVGAAQLAWRPEQGPAPDPLSLAAKAVLDAFGQTGAKNAGDGVDALWVNNIFSWPYADAPGELAGKLGISPKNTYYAPIGGNTPQTFVGRAARVIADGQVDGVLMCGAECAHTARRINKGEVEPGWPEPRIPERIGDGEGDSMGTSDAELLYGLVLPMHLYALFETALRSRLGRTVQGHWEAVGRTLARFSEIAAQNPHAWHNSARTPEDIITPAPGNPLLCHPYTKRMVAEMNVDMGAAVFMLSEKRARELGVDPSAMVYPMGGAELENIWFASRRPSLHDSPAFREASSLAMAQAGVGVDDLALFDFYSCFPCMVEMARLELGLPPDDPRDLTVAGGLPFFGGPFSNYSMHAICSAVERIREDNSLVALVGANGGFNTKHSVGVYGARPGTEPWGVRDDAGIQARIWESALPEPVADAGGSLVVEGYAVRYDRTGSPTDGVVFGRTRRGERALAALEAPSDELAARLDRDWVGMEFGVRHDSPTGRNIVAW